MKKRLPILIVIFSALLVFAVLKMMPSAATVMDKDKDGFPDKIDNCPEQASASNNGCPEKAVANEVVASKDDSDGDGYLVVDFREGKQSDIDDKDPCKPDKTCKTCDEDKDGLNRAEETVKGTNITKADTDGDGVKDKEDIAPLRFGVKANKGDVLTLNANGHYSSGVLTINSELFKYASNVKVKISYLRKDYVYYATIPQSGIMYSADLIESIPDDEYKKSYEYKLEITYTQKLNKGVTIINKPIGQTQLLK
jgi:hypothetical protein